MARPQSVNDEELIARLAHVFRDVGYEGASLAELSRASSLKKASLYHRFPRGKQQMAEEVIAAALTWYAVNVFAPLKSDSPPAVRIATVAINLDQFYAHGRQACLLNMMASPRMEDGLFSVAIKGAFEAIIQSFKSLAQDAGHEPDTAQKHAERAVMLLHGSLVLSRGLGSSEPFESFLAHLGSELLAIQSNAETKP